MSRDLPPKCRDSPATCRELPVTCRSFPLMCRDSPARCRELPVMCRSFPLTCRDFPLRSLKQSYKKEVEFMFLDNSRTSLLSPFKGTSAAPGLFPPAPSPFERAGERYFKTKCYINKKNILQISMKFHCNM